MSKRTVDVHVHVNLAASRDHASPMARPTTRGTHRIHQIARSGHCPIRKNRTITWQKKYTQDLKTGYKDASSRSSVLSALKTQHPNLIICEVMATFVSKFFGLAAKRGCSLEDPESYEIFIFFANIP